MGLLTLLRRGERELEAAAPVVVDRAPVRRRWMKSVMTRLFAAAAFDRTTSGWASVPQPADDIIRQHQRTLVARSRDQAANNDYARAFLRLCEQNIVGPQGVVLQAQVRGSDGKLDAETNEALEAAFAEWGRPENCDVTGRKSWRAMQSLAVITAAKDGEFFVRKVSGPDAGPWGFALQMLDPQRCPVDHDMDRVPGRAGNFVRHGIEFTAYGRPVAYHFTAVDDADFDYRIGGRKFVVIPAEQIIHGFKEEIVGQKRGLPWMATALYRMRHVIGFEHAAVMNARAGAAKMGFFQYREGFGGPDPAEEPAPLEIDAEPLSFHELPPGVEFKEFNPQYPNGEFAVFNKAMLRGIASGLGVAYNTLANDLEGVNFSSIRQGSLDERDRWKTDQEWLIETLVRPVFEAWLPRALLAGRVKVKGRPVSAARVDALRAAEFQPRRWQWIDPRADVEAAVASKNNLLVAPSALIREQGRDPQTVWREIAADIEAMRAAGIPDEFIMAAMGNKITPSKGENDGETDPAGAEQ